MENIVLKKCYNILGTNHRFLKFVFIILASYLILDEFYKYIVIKPTYTSSTKRNMRPDDTPEIILCPDSAINISVLNSKGYDGYREYFWGMGPNNKFIGWGGNNSEDVEKVSEDISTLKTTDDCPQTNENQFWYVNDDKSLAYDVIRFELSKSLYPNSVCCKSILPNISRFYPPQMIQFAFDMSESFKIIMEDPKAASYFILHNSLLVGGEIYSTKDKGFMNYKVQLTEDEKLEDDPAYHCIDYKVGGKYADCIESEIVKQNFEYLNCTPPWMTEKRDLWCNGKNQKVNWMKYVKFLSEVSISESNPGKCLVPCKVKMYQVKKFGSVQEKENNLKRMQIYFSKEVKVTKSSLTLDAMTLMSKIGGYIGLSKNFMWLIILFLSTVGLLVTKFKVHHFK